MVGTPQHILDLLDRLHALSLEQESKLNLADLKGKSDEEKKQIVSDQFVALEKDKCHFMYSIVRAINARIIVEAGTSYGVSTIYLALAAAANESSAGGQGKKPTVIATEHEPGKAAQARQYWAECGDAVSRVIDLREGDLRETLKSDVQDVDLLLLDSKSCKVTLQAPSVNTSSLDPDGHAHLAPCAAQAATRRSDSGRQHSDIQGL